MEENSLPIRPTFKLYKDRAISVGTFIGGPLVAGYLIAENFKQLGQIERIKPTWIISICTTIVIFGVIFLIPNIEKVPNYLIPLIYTGITTFLVQKFQGTAIETHISSGGQTFSIWRAVGIGFIGVAILFLITIAIVLVTEIE